MEEYCIIEEEQWATHRNEVNDGQSNSEQPI